MATIYLSSVDGNDADDGSTWALAKATLAAALTAAGAGGTVYVDDAHAESAASAKSFASPGTAASPVRVICSTRSTGAPPTAVATTGTITTTGANGMSFSGFAYCYGLTFNCGSGAVADRIFYASDNAVFGWVFEDCALKKLGTSGSTSAMLLNSSGASASRYLKLINTPLTFGATGDGFLCRGQLEWRNTTSGLGGTVPTTLFTANSGAEGDILIEGVDLSAAGTGKTLFDVSGTSINSYTLRNCKLGASVTIASGSVAAPRLTCLDMVNCDSGDTNYKYQRQRFEGTISHESTIVRTGGASDGTTPISRKMVSTANARWSLPLVLEVIVWNESTSALTPAFEVVSDGVTFTDAELWAEAEYLGNSGFPYSAFTSDRASSVLATASNQTTSSVTWTTTGLASPTKQKLELSFTPAEKGWIRLRVFLAKASATVYVDPLPTGLGFTSGRQWQTADAYVLEGASTSGGSSAHIIGG